MPGVGKVPARSLLLNILDQFQNLFISFVRPLLRMDLSSASEEDNPSFDVRVEELLQNRTPASTIKVNNWAENKFDTWLETTSFPYLSFEDVDYDRLNYIMERFLCDVGEKLKYRSIHSVITALNRKLKERSLDQDLFVTKRYTAITSSIPFRIIMMITSNNKN